MARYVYFLFAAVFPIVNLTRNVHAFCLLRARIVKEFSHAGGEEVLVADTCRMGLVFEGILPKLRIMYNNCVLGM